MKRCSAVLFTLIGTSAVSPLLAQTSQQQSKTTPLLVVPVTWQNIPSISVVTQAQAPTSVTPVYKPMPVGPLLRQRQLPALPLEQVVPLKYSSGRTLLFTPEDAATVKVFHPLYKPWEQPGRIVLLKGHAQQADTP